ncbi:MAG: hypothetical protein AAGA96_18465 [Verrucomicrobiota bacterium]
MRLVIAGAILVTTCFARAEDKTAKKLKFELRSAHWSTISVRPQTLVTDFSTEGPYLIIQRLPDRRTLLSSFESSRRSQFTPKAVRYIDDEELDEILASIIKIFSDAKKMDRKISGHPIYRPPVTTIEISIRKPSGHKNFSRILDDNGKMLSRLFTTSLDPTRVEQDDDAN